jgi:LacI family transcriptional regulator
MGWSISQQAFALGIAIPHELAVVSIGNSDLWCNLATPPLSSIKFPAEAMGDQAAIMLHDLMEGRSAPLKIEVHSASIIERQSTATMHARSPEIASAVRFIRENFSRPITVAHVADHIGASLSTLERGVKEALGRTPHQELLRLRHAAAIDFLANSEIPMKLIARRCGFTDSKHFSAAFRAAHGLSPSEYREQQRG